MKKLLFVLALCAIIGCKSEVVEEVDIAPVAPIRYAISALSVVNHHEEPDVDKELGCQSLMGTVLQVIEESNNWYKVVTPEEYVAWVSKDVIAFKDSVEIAQWNNASKYFVTSYFGVIYSEPNINSSVICDITLGDLIAKGEGVFEDFYSCILPNGVNGYILKDDVVDYEQYKSSIVVSGSEVIATALKFLGFPYVWGGNSAKGLDCSGLTQLSYHLHGVSLPRNASAQAKVGSDVALDSGFELLEAGDLLFFCNSTSGKVNHVGMYIGNGEFVHSSSSGLVKINSLYEDAPNYYYNAPKLFCAKRIIDKK